MVRPWVKVTLSQYQELERLTKERSKPLSGIIREAVSEFLKKKEFPADTAVSSRPRRTRTRYKCVSAYFPRSNWSLLASISKETGRCKTHLIREAVNEYLESTAVQGKRKGKASNDDG